MQVTTFTIGDLLLGLDVRDVQEILRPQAMTPVPLAPGVVEGLINLRGQIVTALNLRERIGLERPAGANSAEAKPGAGTKPGSGARNGPGAMNVVVRTGENATSLLVDTIGDVVDVEPGALEAPPDNLAGHLRELVTGIHKLDGRLLLLLDLERVLQEKPS